MKVDPRKLRLFFKGAPVRQLIEPVAAEEETIEADDVEAIKEQLADDMSEESQYARKVMPDVAYMELGEAAGAFSCGTCKYATEQGVCLHQAVRAPVSLESGCCNKFEVKPETGIKVVFPPQDEAHHEEREEHEDEDEEGEAQ